MILRTHSHRARQKLEALLGFHPPYFYTFRDGAEFVEVAEPMVDTALGIKGVRRTRFRREDVHPCWADFTEVSE